MFFRTDNSFINVSEIAEVRFHQSKPGEHNATLVLKGGQERSVFLLEDSLDALSTTVVAAPPGYEAHRPYDLDFDDDASGPAIWTPVVAFAIDGTEYQLTPITAEDGHLSKYAVRAPNGRIYTSSEELFNNTADYEESLRENLVNLKGKAAKP